MYITALFYFINIYLFVFLFVYSFIVFLISSRLECRKESKTKRKRNRIWPTASIHCATALTKVFLFLYKKNLKSWPGGRDVSMVDTEPFNKTIDFKESPTRLEHSTCLALGIRWSRSEEVAEAALCQPFLPTLLHLFISLAALASYGAPARVSGSGALCETLGSFHLKRPCAKLAVQIGLDLQHDTWLKQNTLWSSLAMPLWEKAL